MMRPLADMQSQVLDTVQLLDEIEVDFADALGATLSRDVEAPEDLPGFENAAMDGFAVISADTLNPPTTLTVVDDVAAGTLPSTTLTSGTTTRIMTGAPIPDGADAIVPVEATEEGHADAVRILETASVGDHIRPAGGNIRAGSRVFDAGLRLGPAHASVMAALGLRPLVRRRPVIAMMSTGDELVSPATATLERGAIRDSNRTLLAGLLTDVGAEVRDYGIVNDDRRTFEMVLDEAADGVDAIVTSGGVSMGAYDIVKLALQDRGSVGFWKIAMQPGKPFGFGTIEDIPFFGLPGNPVSVFVSFEQFMRPALLTMMGSDRIFRDRVGGILDDGADTSPEKNVFLRVATERDSAGRWHARKSGGQSSNVLSALALADALAVVPAGTARVEPGGIVELEMIHWPEVRSRMEVLGDR